MKQFILTLLVFTANIATAETETQTKPNILVILADDLGLECITAFGGKSYETPNIDLMAKEGMKFSHCFATPYCTPSRAEILTGAYPFYNGVKALIYKPEHKHYLKPEKNITFANLLQKEGYSTIIAGKWQLSILKKNDTIKALGFDDYCCWQILDENNQKTERHYNYSFRTNSVLTKETDPKKYGPDKMTDFLIEKMTASVKNKKPFFAYYTSLLPHYPWAPTPISKDQKMPTQKYGDKKFFPDMVHYLDRNVGKLLKALKDLNVEDNTIVFFLADNATDQHGITSLWNDVKVVGAKGKLHDRGTRVPLVVKWPSKIKADSLCEDLIDISDLFPTVCKIAGVEINHKIHGHDFSPQLLGNQSTPRKWVFMQNAEGHYIRSHKWIVNHKGEVRPVTKLHLAPAKRIAKSKHNNSKEIQFLKSEIKRLLNEK